MVEQVLSNLLRWLARDPVVHVLDIFFSNRSADTSGPNAVRMKTYKNLKVRPKAWKMRDRRGKAHQILHDIG